MHVHAFTVCHHLNATLSFRYNSNANRITHGEGDFNDTVGLKRAVGPVPWQVWDFKEKKGYRILATSCNFLLGLFEVVLDRIQIHPIEGNLKLGSPRRCGDESLEEEEMLCPPQELLAEQLIYWKKRR